MELGLQFDDDLFESSTERSIKKEESYKPKWCEQGWIESISLPDDPADAIHLMKFKADFQYSKGYYNNALDGYEKALGSLGPTSQVGLLKHELMEAKARSLNKLGRYQEALHLMHQLVELQGDDASYWFLIAQLNRNLDNIDGELKALQKCVNVHTWSVNFWQCLAAAYEKAERVAMETSKTLSAYQRQYLCKNSFLRSMPDSNSVINTDDISKHRQPCCSLFQDNFNDFLGHRNELPLHKETDQLPFSNCIKKDADSALVGCGYAETCYTWNLYNYSLSSETSAVDNVHSSQTGLCHIVANNRPLCVCCKGHSKTNIREVANELSTLYISPENGCVHAKQPSECFCKYSNVDNGDQRTLGKLSSPVKHHERFHLFAFCCLIRTRFLLKKADYTSGSFVRHNNSRISKQIDDKISRHCQCNCFSLLPLITKRLASEKNETDSLRPKEVANETINSKDLETCGRHVDFEEHWFGMLQGADIVTH